MNMYHDDTLSRLQIIIVIRIIIGRVSKQRKTKQKQMVANNNTIREYDDINYYCVTETRIDWL